MRHEQAQLSAVTDVVRFESIAYLDRMAGARPEFRVIRVAADINFSVIETHSPMFEEIDARPQWTSEPRKEFGVSAIFAKPFAQKTEEIIVAPQDVASMLEQIRKMQEPMMRDVRERENRRERGDPAVFHAQILSFAA